MSKKGDLSYQLHIFKEKGFLLNYTACRYLAQSIKSTKIQWYNISKLNFVFNTCANCCKYDMFQS